MAESLYATLHTTRGDVVLRLFPPPLGEDGALPAEWIDIAGEWALGDLCLLYTSDAADE